MADAFQFTGNEELEQVRLMRRYNRHIAGLFLEAIGPDQALLEFGAGTGTMSTLVCERARAAKMLCIEIDRTNIAALKSQGFDVITEATQARPESVDVIFSSNVLEHIEDDVGMLKKLYVCLKPGGRAVFWVPAFECLWTAMDDRVAHCRRYTRATLEAAFRNAGFHIERSFYQDSLGFFITLLFKAIGSREGKLNSSWLKIYDRLVFPVSRACDVVCSTMFGKNVVIYARKPSVRA